MFHTLMAHVNFVNILALCGVFCLSSCVAERQAGMVDVSDVAANQRILAEKLDSIIIEKINFDDITLSDLVAFLNQQSKKSKADIGVWIVIQAPLLYHNQKMAIHRRHITLRDAIKLAATSAACVYRVESEKVVILPLPAD